MKSREDRKREARCMGIWALAVVAGLLLLYVLFTGAPTPWSGAIAPLVTAMDALGGVYLGVWLNQHQREEEDERKRRALATILLHEVRLLSIVIKDIVTVQGGRSLRGPGATHHFLCSGPLLAPS